MDNCEINGVHSVLYYCGIEHMLVNINNYIEKGIKERQLIYLYVEPKLYKTIYENLRGKNVEIESFNIINLIEVYNKGGIKHLAQYFVDCEKKSEG